MRCFVFFFPSVLLLLSFLLVLILLLCVLGPRFLSRVYGRWQLVAAGTVLAVVPPRVADQMVGKGIPRGHSPGGRIFAPRVCHGGGRDVASLC